MNLSELSEDTPLSRDEVYQALLRSLRRRKGFGIVFVQCSPAEAAKLIQDIQKDLPQKQVGNLKFDAPIDNLYDLVAELPDRENLNILFIQGLEKSLEPYIKPGFGGDGDYYNLDTVPTILGHLNQRRELFRDYFKNICFVFFLPLFAINYIIRRAPDFYDWSAGVFEFPSDEDSITLQSDSDLLPNVEDSFYLNHGLDLKKLGRYEEAITSYNKALEIKPNDHDAWHNRGLALGNLGRYEEEIASYDKALEIKPNDHDAWYNRGIALRDLGRYEEEIASYDKSLEIEPDDHRVWNNRGIALRNLGRYEEAIASYDKALELKLDYNDAWYNRGIALVNLGRYDAAIASYDKAIEFKPDDHEAWHNRGIALRNLGRNEDAIASYDKALEIKPDKHEAWSNRGVALEKLGRYEEALDSYDKALEIKPNFHEVWFNRGNAFQYLRKYEDAIVSYDKTLEIKPYLDNVWNNKGTALGNLGRYEEAIISFDEALMIRPNLPDTWNNKGLTLRILGRYEEAISYFDKALGINSNYYVAEYNRSSTLKDLGRYEEADASYKKALGIQVQVINLAQKKDIGTALRLVEESHNFHLRKVLEGQKYQVDKTNYQPVDQSLRLDQDTAIIYWYYSRFGLTTFIIKHNLLPKILPSPVFFDRNSSSIEGDEAILDQLQALEQWMKNWRDDYLKYGQDSSNPNHPWRAKMQLRLNSHNSTQTLESILNIKLLIDDYLKDIQNLILIPYGDLNLLPLHCLFPFRFTTTYLPSLETGLNLQNIPQQPATAPLLNLHQPTEALYIKITKNLIDTLNPSAEVQELPNINKTEFLELLGQNYSTLQFMGHGSHNPEEPENSYLNLAEEQLFLKDLRDYPQLDLSSYRLICLVACESGITSRNSLLDEYVGWGSAFLAKRARAVITTLWNVDVRSSAFLMIKFYQLFTPETSAPRALREAQEWMSTLEYLGLVAWYEELADMVRESHPQHREYLRTEADKLRNDLRDNPEKMDENNPNKSRPFGDPYHWAGFICTGLLSG